MDDISKVPTCDLVAEILKRNGVQVEHVGPYDPYAIDFGSHVLEDSGPAILLIVKD